MALTTKPTPATLRTGATARPMVLAAITGAVALVGAIGVLTPPHATDRALAQEVVEFQQHLMPEAAAPQPAEASERLAQRYLDALPPATIQRIHDQVRAEQRTGATSAGREAFVMRRLELYEEALGQTRALAAR